MILAKGEAPGTMKNKVTWICVADAAHARVLQSKGRGTQIESIHDAEYTLNGAKQYTDRPGRTRERANGSRHGMEPTTDPARQEKREMAHGLALWLNEAALSGRFDRLVLVAAPKFLGDLREELNARARGKVINEIPKDYTKISDSEIRERVAEIAPV